MRYPPLVARHFASPVNVGPLLPVPQRPVVGEAGSAARGTWVRFEAEIADGRVLRLAFRAYGCPYVIAACSRATELLVGRPVTALLAFDVPALAAELGAPVERLGRLLVLDDALRNCFRDWDTTQPAAAR